MSERWFLEFLINLSATSNLKQVQRTFVHRSTKRYVGFRVAVVITCASQAQELQFNPGRKHKGMRGFFYST